MADLNCLNCGEVLKGKYCATCGQKSSTHRFHLNALIHDIPHHIFHIEKGIIFNLKGIIHPRLTVHEYISGKRIKYYHPFLFFILSAAIAIFCSHIKHNEISFSFPIEVNANQLYDAGDVLSHSIKYIYLLAVVLFAIPSRLIYYKSDKNVAEFAIINLFIWSWSNLIDSFLILINLSNNFPASPGLYITAFVLTFFVYKQNNFFKTTILSLLSVSLQMLLFLVVIIIAGIFISIFENPSIIGIK